MECRFHQNQQLGWINTSNGPLQGTYLCNMCRDFYYSFREIEIRTQDQVQEMQFILNEIPLKIISSQINNINFSILPFQSFLDRLELQRKNNFKTQSLIDLRESIQMKQKQIEEKFSKILTILREFEQQNTDFEKLFQLDSDSPFSDIYGERLRILAHILENNVIQQWQVWQKDCVNEIQKTIDRLAYGLDDFSKIIKVCKEVKDQRSMEVKEVCGIKYGEQNYIINGSIELVNYFYIKKGRKLFCQQSKRSVEYIWETITQERFEFSNTIRALSNEVYEGWSYFKNVCVFSCSRLPYYQDSKIIENIEQLKYFEEKGYVKQNKKSGLWLYYWKGECLNSGGIYDEQGNKDGCWKEVHDNYQEYQEYQFILAIHKLYVQKNIKMAVKQANNKQSLMKKQCKIRIFKNSGGGEFQNGEKVGNWKEIHEKFCRDLQIIEKGNYKMGKKFEQWDVSFKNQKIGGGKYNQKGDKIDKWIELHECYNVQDLFYYSTRYSRVFYSGRYNEGKKIGRWIIKDNDETIGGGEYRDGNKQGQWTEISGNFQNSSALQISYGAYFKGSYERGQKQGLWTFQFDKRQQYYTKITREPQGEYIEGLKHGNWTELSTNFNENEQIVAKGEYQRGFRIGDWKIIRNAEMMFKKLQILVVEELMTMEGRKVVGLNQMRILISIQKNQKHRSIILLKGGYNSQGLKFGEWSIYDGLVNGNQNIIGGGFYNDKQLKNGIWVEIYDGCKDSRILFKGQYQNGIRVSEWHILETKTNNKMYNQNHILSSGGGKFDDLGRKNGSWIELDINYFLNRKVRYEGNYCSGRKSGVWKARYFDYNNQIFEVYSLQLFSGNGQYDESGMKTGDWTELHHYFSDLNKITLEGSYSEGMKQGTWKIFNRARGQCAELGKYDKKGLKDGVCEMSETLEGSIKCSKHEFKYQVLLTVLERYEKYNNNDEIN
ncbi:unnamed protein product (macronuclear) [Paramecium tetraurelia]|uniref:Fibrinogen C-terminal domain-containing protein n=1 Tax=Paramecium tetraurelia TaxID=5888 RepID=A0BZM5_PARTE|nr:uncharacterized protein GSPATT00005844001 [Paramecium tetraurelia]CAK63992.1 unnamed protein product [Paramecium tetraurelia]|eukprot:XP_001431390.1 hypothetical protein (macronuclear) [Paramecium tetraurelia strain d4-2]